MKTVIKIVNNCATYCLRAIFKTLRKKRNLSQAFLRKSVLDYILDI